MRKSYFKSLGIINLLLIAIIYLACQDSRQSNTIDQNLISKDKLLTDIDTLEFWITRAHGDPYRFTTKEKLDDQFKSAHKRILQEKQMTSNAFAGVVMPIIAELRDGHSQVFLSDLDNIKGNLYFPLKFVFIDKVPFVIEDFSSQQVDIGAEIIKINGVNVKDFFGQILPILHRDGNIETGRYRRLQDPSYFTRILVALQKAKKNYHVTLKYKDQVLDFNLKGLSQNEYYTKKANSLSENNKVLVYKEIDSLKSTALLDINSFNPSYYEKNSFYKQIDEVVTSLNDRKIENLIIDLRDNSGGEDSYSMYLLKYLLEGKFKMNEEVTFKQNNYKFLPDGKHWDIDPKCFKKNDKGTYDATEYLWEDHCTLGEFEPFNNRFKGKVTVLINGFTFSTASDFAAILHYHKRAVFFGEETGGSYIGNVSGFIPTLRLPNSGVKINLPLISIKSPFFESNWTDRGVLPDVYFEPTLINVINNEDGVLIRTIQNERIN